MTDKEFLSEIIATYKKLDELLAEFCFEIKSLDEIILIRSSKLQLMTGAARNLPDTDGLPENLGNYTKEASVKEDNSVARDKRIRYAINVNYLDGIIQPYITSKYPLINPGTGNAVGVLVMIQQLQYNSLQHILLRGINELKEPQHIEFDQYKLTKREKQLIFLFMSGMGSKEMALVLSKLEGKDVAKKTIDNIFTNQILIKFNVFSRESLYEKLLIAGFDLMLPIDLLVGVKIPLRTLIAY